MPITEYVPVPNNRYALSYAAFLARDALRLGAAEDYFLLAIHNAPADPAPHMAYADFAETVCDYTSCLLALHACARLRFFATPALKYQHTAPPRQRHDTCTHSRYCAGSGVRPP